MPKLFTCQLHVNLEDKQTQAQVELLELKGIYIYTIYTFTFDLYLYNIYIGCTFILMFVPTFTVKEYLELRRFYVD